MTHTRIPIQDLPLDKLQEIFTRCLPPDAMSHRQPDTKIAPMLLCHICSYWRAVALGIPRLWTDLYHVLRIYAEVPNRMLLSEGIHKGDLDFLSWWKLNIGTVHPRLRVMVQWVKGNPGFEVGKSDGSLLSLVSAARHLDIDIDFAWWFALIRECVNLESGIFHIRGLGDDEPPEDDPPTCTLPRLQQLVLKWNSSIFPRPLFKNLHLPKLKCLRLDSGLTVQELHELLASTPIPAAPDYKGRGLIPRTSSDVEELTVYVPNLEYLVMQLHFTYNKEYKDISHLIDVLSTTPWLNLGSGRNSIKSQHWESQEILVEGLKTLNPVIEGVKIFAGEDSPWKRDTDLHLKYSLREDCFDNFGFGYRSYVPKGIV
ncbi:hypothetical protein GALMADRAFT_1328599 [Galerina marginata CBS 339.88]|uniref:F-box domain-containing protein n=1 Tax=Galerina marginata (strain CBS 339.88) TaxID=685588 RepID=A0A067T0F7_GALM3|nr:hypothetical protein GALMADRAFT_1328599 [Galerina marginata CBS 339.88]